MTKFRWQDNLHKPLLCPKECFNYLLHKLSILFHTRKKWQHLGEHALRKAAQIDKKICEHENLGETCQQQQKRLRPDRPKPHMRACVCMCVCVCRTIAKAYTLALSICSSLASLILLIEKFCKVFWTTRGDVEISDAIDTNSIEISPLPLSAWLDTAKVIRGSKLGQRQQQN